MPSKEYRQTVVSWGARTTPCPTYSQPSPEVISTSQIRLHKPTRAPWQWKLKSVVQRKGSPSPGPTWTVLGEPWPCCPDMKPIKSGQHKSTFWSWGTCVYGTHYGMQGKGILGLHKIYYGCLGEEPKVGERMDLGDLWRNNYGENKGVRRFKKKEKKANCVSASLPWLCPAHDQFCLSFCLSCYNLFLLIFLGEGLPAQCVGRGWALAAEVGPWFGGLCLGASNWRD